MRRTALTAVVSLGLASLGPIPARASEVALEPTSAEDTAPEDSDAGDEPDAGVEDGSTIESSDEPTPDDTTSTEVTPPDAKPPTDTVVTADGSRIDGRITQIAEGAYVTVETDAGLQTLPWHEVLQVRIDRGDDDVLELDLSRPTFEAEQSPSVQTPHIEIQTRDGRPVSLLRLRSANKDDARYSTGYDEVCRAPCQRTIEAGSRRFFVDRNPWTASKVFELPDADYVEIRVRPGRVKMRKAGTGLMISGAAGTVLGIVALTVPTQTRFASDIGITLVSLSSVAIPLGGILFAVSRAKAEAKAAKAPSSTSPRARTTKE